MTGQSDPYVRVYYRITDDPKFAGIYDDDHALATWLRLLLTADAMYPSPAPIPHGTRMADVKKLVEAGLLDIGTGNRYRVHGMASERAKRSEWGRNAAAVRWQSERNAHPMLSEPSLAKPNQTEPSPNGARALEKTELKPLSEIVPDMAAKFGSKRHD